MGAMKNAPVSFGLRGYFSANKKQCSLENDLESLKEPFLLVPTPKHFL
jgi:hypothetical protein